jgi:O-antigen/teichoic acid export membrane protein
MIITRVRQFIAQKTEQEPVLGSLLTLVHDSSVYLIGSAINGLGTLLLIPLYIHYLDPAQFGIYALIDITVIVIVGVTQLGYGVSYLKWFAEIEDVGRPKLLGTVLVSSAVAALFGGAALVALLVNPIGQIWLQTPNLGFLWTLLPIIVLENLEGHLFNNLRARRRPVAYAISSGISIASLVMISLWLVAIKQEGIAGVFLGRLLADLVTVAILAGLSMRHIKLSFQWQLVKPMVRFGAPVVWGAIAVLLLDASGRFFLSHYSTLEQVGFYSAGIKVSGMMRTLFVVPFAMAWGGLMFQIARWPKARIIYSKVFEYVLVGATLLALGTLLFAPALFHILTTPAYSEAIQVFPLLLLVQVCTVVQYPASIGLYLKDKTKFFILIYTISIVVTLALNWVLVPIMGMQGAGIALAGGWLVIVGLELLIGGRYYPLQINWKALMLACAIFLAIFVIGQYTAQGITLKDITLQIFYFTIATASAVVWSIISFRRGLPQADTRKNVAPS